MIIPSTENNMNTFLVLLCSAVITLVASVPTPTLKPTDTPLAPDHTEHELFDDILKANQDCNGTTLREGDILVDDESTSRSRRAALVDSNRLWPNGIVHYAVSSSMQYADELRDAMDEIETKTCIRFVQYNGLQNHALYIQNGVGCSSYIGKYKRYPSSRFQVLNLGTGCGRVGIAQHELMHALGFHHEQSRPDRDNFVTINFANIRPGYENNFQKMSTSFFQTFTPYDYQGVMHYSSTAFSRSPGLRTIVPKPNPNTPIGQRNGISAKDALDINQLYNCLSAGALNGAWGRWSSYGACSVSCGGGTKTRTRSCNNPRPLNGGSSCSGSDTLSVTCNNGACVAGGSGSCNFETGMCSWTTTIALSSRQLTWTRRKGATPSRYTGPSADHTLGSSSGYYVYAEATGKSYFAQGHLESPALSILGSNGKRCLSFWYHMYGTGMGYLVVGWKNNGSTRSSYLWHAYGNKYNRWHFKRQTIPASTAGKVRLSSLRGWSYTSDIALDDITITDGAC